MLDAALPVPGTHRLNALGHSALPASSEACALWEGMPDGCMFRHPTLAIFAVFDRFLIGSW